MEVHFCIFWYFLPPSEVYHPGCPSAWNLQLGESLKARGFPARQPTDSQAPMEQNSSTKCPEKDQRKKKKLMCEIDVWWNLFAESCNFIYFKFLNTSDFCKLKSVQPLWNLAMREPWAVFLSRCFLTLQCEVIILLPKNINQLYNIQTFSIEASAKPAASRKYLAQSALAKVISLKRMALPGAKITRKALDTWNSRTQMEMKKGKHIGTTGHLCNRSIKGKKLKTYEKLMFSSNSLGSG